MENNIAAWKIELNVDCPHCKESVDLLEDVDFFDGRSIELGEHETFQTTNMEVMCPLCHEHFNVDLTY